MEPQEFNNYVEVDEGNNGAVAKLTDQEIVSEIKSVNEQDNSEIESESEPETKVADVCTVQAL